MPLVDVIASTPRSPLFGSVPVVHWLLASIFTRILSRYEAAMTLKPRRCLSSTYRFKKVSGPL